MEGVGNYNRTFGHFEQMSGLKINFHKSEVYCLGNTKNRQDAFESIFTCQGSDLPMKYLGILIDKKRIKNSDWNGPIGKIEKKLGSWIGKNMSIAGRTILINSSISSIPLYMLSFYRLPMGVDKKFSTLSSKFLWGDDPTKKKYHLVRWSDVCLPKD
jgi:hypothetical protein